MVEHGGQSREGHHLSPLTGPIPTVAEVREEEKLSQESSTTKGKLLLALRILLIALALGLAVAFVVSRWNEVSEVLATLSLPVMAASFLAVVAGIGCGMMSWQVYIDHLGDPVGVKKGAQIFLVGSIGKYIPGSVWAYILQIELGNRYGVRRGRVFAATLFSLAAAVAASLLAGGLVVPLLAQENPAYLWLYLLLPLGLGFLHPWVLSSVAALGFKILKKDQARHELNFAVTIKSLLWALGAYTCYGLHLYLLATDTGKATFGVFTDSVGAIGVAMTAGLLAFFLPSGVGARETVIVLVLGPTIGTATAVAFALVSRVFFVVADLLVAGGVAGFTWWRRNRMHDMARHELSPDTTD